MNTNTQANALEVHIQRGLMKQAKEHFELLAVQKTSEANERYSEILDETSGLFQKIPNKVILKEAQVYRAMADNLDSFLQGKPFKHALPYGISDMFRVVTPQSNRNVDSEIKEAQPA